MIPSLGPPPTLPPGLPEGAAWFAFKGWGLWHGPGALKVCTDACWLGAIAHRSAPPAAQRVGDLGAGTGLLAGMLAHRRPQIVADLIEPNTGALHYSQANIGTWGLAHRLTVIGQTLELFAQQAMELGNRYDLLMINPPFYEPGPAPGRDDGLDYALLRQPTFDLDRWAAIATTLLAPDGQAFMMHLPEQEKIIQGGIKSAAGVVLGSHLLSAKPGHRVIRQITVFGLAKSIHVPVPAHSWAQMDEKGQADPDFRFLLAPFYPHF